jgi:branched-chain amino acid aminotransferase
MMTTPPLYVFFRDAIVPEEKALVHVSDLAIQRGYGIFDFFKIQNGHPFFLPDYLDRFYASADVMRLKVPYDRAQLTGIIYSLIEKNKLPSSGIKMLLTGGYSPDGYQVVAPNLILTQQPLTLPPPSQIEKGVKIITHPYVRDIPEVKTINYSMGIWLTQKTAQQNATDVLYQNAGLVSELPRSNFFIVKKDNSVWTAAGNVLRGVTRKNILGLSSHVIGEGEVSLQDAYEAREAFLTSTTKRIVPIVQIDDHVIGDGKPGAVSLGLLKELVRLEEEDVRTAAFEKK